MCAVGRFGGLLVVLACALCFTGALASDDWDWGAFEAMDDAPVTKKSTVERTESSGQNPATVTAAPRPTETNVPDYDAPVRPAYPLFAGAPDFMVVPSKRDVDMHPCSNCHQWILSNPNQRELKQPHENIELEHGLHGKGQFWCFTCHGDGSDRGLKTLEGTPVEFADAYIVCSQCHTQQARDWAHGAHGKRTDNWQGERQVLNCTACHDQHRPTIKARKPMPGPEIRVGLPRPEHWAPKALGSTSAHATVAPWRNEVGTQDESALGHVSESNLTADDEVVSNEALQ